MPLGATPNSCAEVRLLISRLWTLPRPTFGLSHPQHLDSPETLSAGLENAVSIDVDLKYATCDINWVSSVTTNWWQQSSNKLRPNHFFTW
jgi:hypothetical protein